MKEDAGGTPTGIEPVTAPLEEPLYPFNWGRMPRLTDAAKEKPENALYRRHVRRCSRSVRRRCAPARLAFCASSITFQERHFFKRAAAALHTASPSAVEQRATRGRHARGVRMTPAIRLRGPPTAASSIIAIAEVAVRDGVQRADGAFGSKAGLFAGVVQRRRAPAASTAAKCSRSACDGAWRTSGVGWPPRHGASINPAAGGLALGRIVAQALANGGGRRRSNQHIVDNLEGRAPGACHGRPTRPHPARRGLGQHKAHAAGGFKQLGGFVLDHAQIGRLRPHRLPMLSRHWHPSPSAMMLVASAITSSTRKSWGADHHPETRGCTENPHQHAGGVAKQRGGGVAPRRRVVHPSSYGGGGGVDGNSIIAA